METAFLLLALCLSPSQQWWRGKAVAVSHSKNTLTERQDSGSCIDFLEMKFHFWVMNFERALPSRLPFGGLQNPDYTQHGSLG